jgi:hypothetical protein
VKQVNDEPGDMVSDAVYPVVDEGHNLDSSQGISLCQQTVTGLIYQVRHAL